MEKFSEFLSDRASRLEKHLEKWLSQDANMLSTEPSPKTQLAYEAQTDTSYLEKLSHDLPEEELDRVVIVFSRLSIYFEAGLLFEKAAIDWLSRFRFEKGEFRLTELPTYLQIPDIKSMQVLKTSPKPILAEVQLSKNIERPEDLTVLLMRPTEEYCFLLFSRLPDLWLKEHMQKISHHINLSLA